MEGSPYCLPMGDVLHERLDAAGRLMVPAEMREALGLKPGSSVTFQVENGELRISGQRHLMKDAAAYLRQFIPEGVDAVEEFLAERCLEAARDEDKYR
jgi:AbrB family looped-hinge helix DNA binding protein